MSAMREIKTVSIIGLGNLGIAFGYHLSKRMPKEDLRFIADRERIERYNRDGSRPVILAQGSGHLAAGGEAIHAAGFGSRKADGG